MLPLNRNVTRCVLSDEDITLYTSVPSADTKAYTSGALYVGYQKPFASRYFKLGTLNSNSVTLTSEYWNGSAWTALQGVIDQTLGFRRNGWISWANDASWREYELLSSQDEELFWVRFTPSGALSDGTTLQMVGNLFCDDTLLRSYYPELITDTRYLPSGRNDFLEQYVAAKDLIVTRLKQDGIIDNENQVLDINEVAIAATHAAAWVILSPIANSDEERERANEAFKNFNRELNKVKLDLDFDSSGTIDEDEKDQGNIFIKRG